MNTSIVIDTLVDTPPEQVWKLWTEPEHITKWNSASPEWHTPRATNDLRVGGAFSSRMEAVDGSMGFDFEGTYTAVEPHTRISYTIADGRSVEVRFAREGTGTRVQESFEPEGTNPLDMQQAGWQSILDSFARYAAGLSKR